MGICMLIGQKTKSKCTKMAVETKGKKEKRGLNIKLKHLLNSNIYITLNTKNISASPGQIFEKCNCILIYMGAADTFLVFTSRYGGGFHCN